MSTLQTNRNMYEARPVFDWNNFEIGTVAETEFDPRTREPKKLKVDLTDEAATRVGTSRLEVPVDYVYGIRKDEVTLDRSLDEITLIEQAARRVEIASPLR